MKPILRHAPAARSIAALLVLSGCASYIDAKREVARAPETIRAAEIRRDAARGENESLRREQAEAEAEQQRLGAALAGTNAQLAAVQKRIKTSNAASAAQRSELARLTQRQKDLEAEMAAMNAAPPASSPGDTAARQLQLDALRLEQENLQKQLNALVNAM